MLTNTPQIPVAIFLLNTNGLLELHLTTGVRTHTAWVVTVGEAWHLAFAHEHCVDMSPN